MEENLELYRGNSFTFTLEIEELNQDLDSCFLSCKKIIKEYIHSELILKIQKILKQVVIIMMLK